MQVKLLFIIVLSFDYAKHFHFVHDFLHDIDYNNWKQT